jgi:hypothetical protein
VGLGARTLFALQHQASKVDESSVVHVQVRAIQQVAEVAEDRERQECCTVGVAGSLRLGCADSLDERSWGEVLRVVVRQLHVDVNGDTLQQTRSTDVNNVRSKTTAAVHTIHE